MPSLQPGSDPAKAYNDVSHRERKRVGGELVREHWQTEALAQLSRRLEADPDVKALVVTGSLVDGKEVDVWSDIDLKIVLADDAVERYFASVTWLEPLGRPIGVERHVTPPIKTLRVCLDDLRRRVDVSLMPESNVLLSEPADILWSRMPGLERHIAPVTLAPPTLEPQDIARMAEGFWFRVASAVAKVVRNDLLIGMHLALDLVRDCLVLQMIRRDREFNTTIHRTGGWGNELVAEIAFDVRGDAPEEILDLIAWSCRTFDELAGDLSPTYERRAALVLPGIDAARAIV